MRFRKLRIAWSVACGIACLLLIILWVRSYSYIDSFHFNIPGWPYGVRVNSIQGGSGIVIRDYSYASSGFMASYSTPTSRFNYQDHYGQRLDDGWFHLLGNKEVLVPYWFVVMSSGALAAAPWVRWSKRFNLRTLLIATTLVAMVLGLIVWSVR